MSQRECAGFNWPPLSIPAEEPVSISPVAVSRTGPQIAAACDKSCGEPFRAISDSAPSNVRTFFSPSELRGVGQPASHATRPRSAFSGTFAFGFPPSFQSRVVGVGHPVQSLPDVRRADARSRGNTRPAGVTISSQVKVQSVEPRLSVLFFKISANFRDKIVEAFDCIFIAAPTASNNFSCPQVPRAAFRPNSITRVFVFTYPPFGSIRSSDGVFILRFSDRSNGFPLNWQIPTSSLSSTHSTSRSNGSPRSFARLLAAATSLLARVSMLCRRLFEDARASKFRHSLQTERKVPLKPVFAKIEELPRLPQ